MHFFTALQLLCLVVLYALKEIDSIAVVFPFFIALLGPIRNYFIVPLFTDQELAVLRTLATQGCRGGFRRLWLGVPGCHLHFSGDILWPEVLDSTGDVDFMGAQTRMDDELVEVKEDRAASMPFGLT